MTDKLTRPPTRPVEYHLLFRGNAEQIYVMYLLQVSVSKIGKRFEPIRMALASSNLAIEYSHIFGQVHTVEKTGTKKLCLTSKK